MRVKPFFVPVIVIGTLVGTILIANIAGAWSVSGRTTVDMEKLTPADIKGWMTLQQVIDGIGISQEELYALMNIPADIAITTALKDLESIVPEFETSTLRDALTVWASGKQEATTSDTQSESVVTATIQPTATPKPEIHNIPTSLPEDQILPADQIKGKMTLREVSDQCAVPLDALLTALKLPPNTNPDTQIKTLITDGVLTEVTDVQRAVTVVQGN